MSNALRGILFAAAILGFASAGGALAQKWPEKPVRIVTPFAPGGGTDLFSRMLAQRFTEVYGQQFIVENRPGAGSTLGTEHVAKSPPDGYTLLMTSATHTFTPGLYAKLRYDPIRDFAAVAQVVRVPHVIVVLPTFPASNLQEFVKVARSHPGDVLYASSGQGSAMHLAGALFGMVTKTKLTHVPYKGNAPALNDVLGGVLSFTFDTVTTAAPHIASGSLRPLAVSGPKRASALPKVPTMQELGYKGFDITQFVGLMAPAKTDPAIVRRLNQEVVKALKSPEVVARLQVEGGNDLVGDTPEAFGATIARELAMYRKLVTDANIHQE
jgi:tripartite-type tricarboxylate transporter receptor subunit TctC